jgi:hypothetical protein
MSEQDDSLSVEEMAAMHDMDVTNVYRILRADQKLPPDERRIQGAYKVGTKFRGDWRIPREGAENFQRSTRGRKPDQK